MDSDLIRAAVILLGSYMIAMPVAALLELLGHAGLTYVMGGSVSRLQVNPLGTSYVWYGRPPRSRTSVALASEVVSALCAAALLAVAWHVRSPWWIPLGLIAIELLIGSGVFVAVNAVLCDGDKCSSLRRRGVPLWLLLAGSAVFIAAGGAAACALMPWIDPTTPPRVGPRVFLLLAGIMPYLVAMWVYQRRHRTGEQTRCAAYVVAGVVLGPLIAWLSTLWAAHWPDLLVTPGGEQTWTMASVLFAVGLVLVAGLTMHEHRSEARRHVERPSDEFGEDVQRYLQQMIDGARIAADGESPADPGASDARKRGRFLERLVALVLMQAQHDGASRTWFGYLPREAFIGYTIDGEDREMIPPPAFVGHAIHNELVHLAKFKKSGDTAPWTITLDDTAHTFMLELQASEKEARVTIALPDSWRGLLVAEPSGAAT